jgi:KAP-like P-loop domain-containing protein
MNEYITDYLNYYINLTYSPQFAVLLRGKWGSGKSFYAKNFIETNGKEKFLYITLYGVKSAKEINDQIFEQLHPVLASKGMKIAGKVVRGILKTTLKIDLENKSEIDFTSSIPDIKLPEYLTSADSRIMVFDDLERCSMDLATVLGYINQFVEGNESKVIIIANEQEIISNEESQEKNKQQAITGKFDSKTFEASLSIEKNHIKYLRIKEKLIGKSFEIESDIEAALTDFIKELQSEKFIELLNQNRSLVKNFYKSADYNNLRHLKQTLLDLERFYLLLPEFAFNKPNLITDLVACFLSMSFELKAGDIKEEDIKKLFYGDNPLSPGDKNSLFQKLRQKYSLNAAPLNPTLWFEFFNKGTILNKKELEQSIKNSTYFSDENTPAHIKLWRWYELNDDEFSSLYKIVYNSFKNKQIEDQDLLLHITSMFLYYSEIKLIQLKKGTIISIAKRNAANLKSNGKLSVNDERIPAYGSLGFHGRDIQEFKDFKDYLKKEAQESIIFNHPKLAKELFSLMKNSPQEFRQKITLNNTLESKYYNIPIFKHIPVKQFLKAFLELGNKERTFIGYTLKERYKFTDFADNLIDELEWLKQIREELIKEHEKKKYRPSGFVIQGVIDNDLTPSINNLESKDK